MITKQNYERIAGILYNFRDNNFLIQEFIDYFKSDNPLFDEDKFLKAVNGNWQEQEKSK